jgi:hypothetical protein
MGKEGRPHFVEQEDVGRVVDLPDCVLYDAVHDDGREWLVGRKWDHGARVLL